MSLMRLPLSAWAWFITSCMGLTAFAVLLPACILVILDHVAGTSFFVPSGLVMNDQLLPHSGGSTLLWQHLFWFFGHPEVYIAIVPGIGIVSHILVTNMRKPMLSQQSDHLFHGSACRPQLHGLRPSHVCQRDESVLLAGVLFPHAGHHHPSHHHRCSSGSSVCMAPSCGSTRHPCLRLGFISMFVSGGVSGFFLAQPSIDIMLHATYFVVGHFHMVMGVAAMFGIFAGTYFWFPKMAGRMMNETLGKLHFWLSFVGAYCIFMPFHYLGMAGNVRRYSSFPDDFLQPLIPVHRLITVAALITGAAQLIFLYNLIHSRFWGKPAPG